jgi:hypothetical protein
MMARTADIIRTTMVAVAVIQGLAAVFMFPTSCFSRHNRSVPPAAAALTIGAVQILT